MHFDPYTYIISVNNIENMEAINNNFHEIGGMVDKVSKKLTDKQYKDMYDKLGELKTQVGKLSESSHKFIKISYSYRYVRYWVDDDGEQGQDIEIKYHIHKIFKIIYDDEVSYHDNKNKNIETMLDDKYDIELDKKFLDFDILTSSKIDFAFQEVDDDDDGEQPHRFGYITLHDYQLY